MRFFKVMIYNGARSVGVQSEFNAGLRRCQANLKMRSNSERIEVCRYLALEIEIKSQTQNPKSQGMPLGLAEIGDLGREVDISDGIEYYQIMMCMPSILPRPFACGRRTNMRLRITLMASLVLVASSFAQPQAPITWGEARLLMNAPDSLWIDPGVAARGDTIAFLARCEYANGHELSAVSISTDDGVSFSLWHMFLTPDSMFATPYAIISNAGIWCCTEVRENQRGFYRTNDRGLTWTHPLDSLVMLKPYELHGDTAWCGTYGNCCDSVRWTSDGGRTFSTPTGIDFAGAGISDISASDSTILVLSRAALPDYGFLTTYLATAPRTGGPFATPIRLNPDFRETYSSDVEFDRDGAGMILSCARYHSFFPGGGGEFLNITRDHGRTWSGPDTLRALESGGKPFIRHAGREWIAMWWDSCVSAPFAYYGEWFCFSANAGRSWYPIHQVFGEDLTQGWTGPIDMTADRVRFYAYVYGWNGVPGRYYLQWEGQIQKDTLSPVISTAVTLPETITADTTVRFAASAADNDSLWQMEVVIKHPDRTDSATVLLARRTDNAYFADWRVPFDSSEFLYYYRGEDMWENVTCWPDSGMLTFTTQPNAADPPSLRPLSFSLSSYPNPFNSFTVISFSIPRTGETKIALYDITGRLVRVVQKGRIEAGEHRVTLNAEGMASGIYFVRLESAGREVTGKIVLLR
jgi:hypothetical protein